MHKYHSEIEEIVNAFGEGDIASLGKLLPALLEEEVPQAIRINSRFFYEDASEEECDRIYVEGMFRAAELGDLKANFQVGTMFDVGEFGVEQDKVNASFIFKDLAELGHSHSILIHACELLHGSEAFFISV
jgi:TPR repeat protein